MLRSDLFARPTLNELRQAWRGNVGGVRLVNCLNPAQTGFPRLTLDELKELAGGPYLVRLAESYLSDYRINVVQNQPYVNLQHYHNTRRQGNVFMPGIIKGLLTPPPPLHDPYHRINKTLAFVTCHFDCQGIFSTSRWLHITGMVFGQDAVFPIWRYGNLWVSWPSQG